MQQPPPMLNVIPPFPNTNITTEQIQKYLDENKQLILAILDNQNLGKLAECAQFQAKLQHNLMYLAAIADAQPQAPPVPAQMPPQAVMQQAGHFMQHPQMAAAQQSLFPQKVPLQFNPQQMADHQQQQQLHHQHAQTIQGHMAMRPGATSNGVHAMHSENSLGGSVGQASSAGLGEIARSGVTNNSVDGRGNKQEAGVGLESGSSNVHPSSVSGTGITDAEPSYLKGSEEGAKMP